MSEEIAVPGRTGVATTGGAGAPVHSPGEMGFREAVGLDEAWQMISPAVRQRVSQRAGSLLERWAWLDAEGSPNAIVLGSQGLVSATATRGPGGRAAHLVETVQLSPESARVATVHEDTAARRGGPGGGPATATLRLPSDDMRAFLGHLPARAQQLLQEPFVGGARPPRGDHHYLRTSAASGFGRLDLEVFCYLFDARWLTCVTGEATTYGVSFAAARWELTCRRIAVRPK